MDTDSTESASGHSRLDTKTLAALLVVSIAGVALVAWLLLGRSRQPREIVVDVVQAPSAQDAGVYTSEVIDATRDRDITAEEGRRYRVRIEDESREGASGVARIGGLVTFVPGLREGDIAVIEVTRIKRSTAEARVIEHIGHEEPPPRVERRREAQQDERIDDPVRAGSVYRGKVEDRGRKGDGIVRVEGKVVFVEGAEPGQRVEFRVVENLPNFARGTLVRVLDGSDETDSAPTETANEIEEGVVLDGISSSAEDVQAGAVFDVVVTEQDRKMPEVNGVTRIGGLVVFVPKSQPGDQVRIRIRDRRPRFAFADTIENKGPIQLEQ